MNILLDMSLPNIIENVHELIIQYSLFNESLQIQKENISKAISLLHVIKNNQSLSYSDIIILLESVKYLVELK